MTATTMFLCRRKGIAKHHHHQQQQQHAVYSIKYQDFFKFTFFMISEIVTGVSACSSARITRNSEQQAYCWKPQLETESVEFF